MRKEISVVDVIDVSDIVGNNLRTKQCTEYLLLLFGHVQLSEGVKQREIYRRRRVGVMAI